MATITTKVILLTVIHCSFGSLQSTLKSQPATNLSKQINSEGVTINTKEDQKRAETQIEEEGGNHGNYFMYQNVPHHDHYEFGHRRGNHHHFQEKYEKAQPHHGHFKTKARWGDKHGGYGEHYWDYNHGDHHGDEDDEGSNGDEGGDENHPVPDYQPEEVQEKRMKRHKDADEVQEENLREKKDDEVATSTLDLGLRLAYDMESGTVVNEATGQRFYLTPIN